MAEWRKQAKQSMGRNESGLDDTDAWTELYGSGDGELCYHSVDGTMEKMQLVISTLSPVGSWNME